MLLPNRECSRKQVEGGGVGERLSDNSSSIHKILTENLTLAIQDLLT